jgi:putative FmdB family regulatory protein
MPTYDYECAKCGHTFDAFQNMSDDPLKKCPECGKNSLKRLIGGGLGVIFKGSGFYVTDSRSSGSSKKEPAAASGSNGGGESTGSGEKSDSGASKKESSSEGTGSKSSSKVAG